MPEAESHQPSRRWSLLSNRWDILLVISAGGALGSLARWGVGELLPWPGDSFPWATFAENVSGGLALGIVLVFLLEVWPPTRYVRPFVGVGLLGGYTTFSTYMLETRALVSGDQVPIAFGYVFGTLAAGLSAVWIGIALARLTVRLAQRRGRVATEQEVLESQDMNDESRSSP